MNKIKFIIGFCWVLMASLVLWASFSDVGIFVTSLSLNGGLYGVFVLLFYKPFRQKSLDILQPSLLLITLQMLIFLTVAGVFWYGKLPFLYLFWALLVFIGVLTIQVWEQITFLKSVEKSQE
ncbi:MAG: hypothetical protein ACKO5L_08665 [Bacteroidota bacterium]